MSCFYRAQANVILPPTGLTDQTKTCRNEILVRQTKQVRNYGNTTLPFIYL